MTRVARLNKYVSLIATVADAFWVRIFFHDAILSTVWSWSDKSTAVTVIPREYYQVSLGDITDGTGTGWGSIAYRSLVLV